MAQIYETFAPTLSGFLALAKSAGWTTGKEQVESIMVSICALVEDGRLPCDTVEKLFTMLEELAMAERNPPA